MANPSPLKRILLAEGRRQTWLAGEVGIDPADLNRIVNRGLIPSDRVKQAIADALGRKVEELWPDAEQSETSRAAA